MINRHVRHAPQRLTMTTWRFWIAVTGALLLTATTQPITADDSAAQALVVRAFFDDPSMIKLLADRDVWTVDTHKSYALLEIRSDEIEQLEKSGFRIEVDERRTARYNRVFEKLPNQRAGIPGFPCYRTVDETLADAAALAAANPQLASWTDIGDSWEKTSALGGNDIMLLTLTNSANAGPKPRIFLIGGLHAREYATAELATRFAEMLIAGYDEDADITWLLDHHEVQLVLQANPDGRQQAQTGLSWRKNTNQNYCGVTSNSRGADLNRNFPFQWGCCGGSSNNQCSTAYRGPFPSSEPESTALIDHTRTIFPDQRPDDLVTPAPDDATGVFIDIHSFGEVLLWSWGFDSTPSPNSSGLQSFARKLGYFNGYDAVQALSGATEGTTKDFAYGELGVAAYTLEIGTEFFQDCGAFEGNILPDNLQALLYAARAARTPYQTATGPDVVDLVVSGGAVAAGTPVALNAVADDTRYDNDEGTEPTQAVTAAQVYVDTPPWEDGATATALAPGDGVFDGTIETISGTVDTSGLDQGRHVLFVRARDADDNWGPMSAAFVYVIDPASAPTIHGRVFAADTLAALAADVSAGPFAASNDPVSGDYTFQVVPGTYDVVAVPESADYGPRTFAAIQASASASVERDIPLYPYCDLFIDDVESGNSGWNPDSPWAITTEASSSPTHSWTDSPGGEYGNNTNVALTSPSFDLTGVAGLTLEFMSLCDTEASYDYCIVEIQNDGGPWQEIARFDGATPWQLIDLPLTSLDGVGDARFRFRLQSDFSITENGWHVDDIRLRGAGPACIDTDADSDGVIDGFDNCTLSANADQRDTDADGYGNVCDPDFNNDGIVNTVDLGIMKLNFFAVGDLDSDLNGDGTTNALDLGILKSYFFSAPGPAAL